VIAEVAGAIVQVLVVGAGAPLLVGALRTLKARLVGRRGPSPWQPYANLRKLLAKEAVVSTTTSWVFRATPYILAATLLVTGLIVPVTTTRPPLAFAGNIILLVYLFMLGTFFLALAGLDAGSAFGGMGASREVAVAALAEPTVIVAVFALALRADTIDLGRIVERFRGEPWLAANPGKTATLTQVQNLTINSRLPSGAIPLDFFHVPIPQGFATTAATSFDITTLSGLKLYRLRQAYDANFGTLGASVPYQPRYIQFGLKLYF